MHFFDTPEGQVSQAQEYLRVLDLCRTAEEWNGVMANIVRKLAILAMPGRTNSSLIVMHAFALLQQRIAAGFIVAPNRAPHLLQADQDAHTIARYSGAKTIAEAIRWLRSVETRPGGEPLTEAEARRRVNRAREHAGLKLGRAAPFGRKPPSY